MPPRRSLISVTPAFDQKRSARLAQASPRGTQRVSRAADGVQQRRGEPFVELLSQTAYMNIDDVGLRIEVVIPDLLQEHGAGDDVPGMPHQILEEPELAR